jgi:O-antigen/teichoic acid export membrane protein
MGYSVKAAKGIGWVGLLQIAIKGITFLKYVIIARFISPPELGVFGIAILTTGFFEAITETGISAFIVQTHQSEEKYVSSAWFVTIIRGIMLCLITIAIAYPISIFFNSHTAFLVVAVASLLPLVRGFINPATAKFQKHLDFDREFIYRAIITLFDFAVAAIFIILYKNSLALIVALIFSAAFELALSLLAIKPRPRLIIELEKIRELFHFGKWVTLVVGVNYFVSQLDSIVVGRLLGTGNLGQYQLSQKFSLQIMSDSGSVFSRVTFPLFAKIKDDIQRTKRALCIILGVVSLLFGSLTIFLFVFSKPVLLFSVGARWLAADIPLKIFSLTGLITAFMAIITSMFLAHARQDITAKMLIVRLIILAIIIVPSSIKYGIVGASISSFVSYLLVVPIALWGIQRILSNKK